MTGPLEPIYGFQSCGHNPCPLNKSILLDAELFSSQEEVYSDPREITGT